MNKKSGRPEELVSCADCGRSGECGPSCTCAHRPAAVPPAPPAVFHGGEGGVGKLVVVMISSTEAFSGHWIFFYFGSQEIMPGEPGKREGRNFGPAFGLFMKWIFLCVCCCEIVWKHLEAQAALSCSGCCTRNTHKAVFVMRKCLAHWRIRKHE